MKTYYKHLHLHEVSAYIPSITFRIDRQDDSDELKVSWAICSVKDNFCRRTGRVIADKNIEDGLYVSGIRDNKAAPIIVDIFNTLLYGDMSIGNSKKVTPEFYRVQAVAAIEECHMAEAFQQSSIDAEATPLWSDNILPWLFRTNFFNYIAGPR
jgi:hypothetical protein